MLAIRLPPDIEQRLAKLAKLTGRSKTFYARKAILEHLDDLEDYYLAERRASAIATGKERTISLEEVMRENDIALSSNAWPSTSLIAFILSTPNGF